MLGVHDAVNDFGSIMILIPENVSMVELRLQPNDPWQIICHLKRCFAVAVVLECANLLIEPFRKLELTLQCVRIWSLLAPALSLFLSVLGALKLFVISVSEVSWLYRRRELCHCRCITISCRPLLVWCHLTLKSWALTYLLNASSVNMTSFAVDCLRR